MRRLLTLFFIIMAILSAGCITQADLDLSSIVMVSEFYGPGNYTTLESDILGDQQSVIFYVEVRGFQTKKVEGKFEFWLSMDVVIGDSDGNIYVEKVDEKEIHVTNVTEKPGMIFYKYPWYTGNMVISGGYWVKIVTKDKLSGKIKESRREFEIDLTKHD